MTHHSGGAASFARVVQRRIASTGEDMLAHAIGWPLLRLSLGRWPTKLEVCRFRQAFTDRPARLPALLRGLGSNASIRNHFIDLLTPPPPIMPPLLFLHIEKTAGTSVIDHLIAQFPPGSVDPDIFHGAPGHMLSPIPDDKRRYDFIWGHQALPALLRCQPPQRFVVTFLREPKQRILSLYRFWSALREEEIARNAQHSGVLAARSRGLLGFLNSPEPEVMDFIDNVYARRLTGLFASHTPPGQTPPSPETFEAAALAALDSIDFIGITEHVAESLHRLAVRTGTTPPSIVPREKVLNTMQLDPNGVFGPSLRLRLGAAEMASLERLTRVDRKIYAAALARF